MFHHGFEQIFEMWSGGQVFVGLSRYFSEYICGYLKGLVKAAASF
jgi:hypothetical protein